MKVGKALASTVLALAVLSGAVACDGQGDNYTNDDSGNIAEYEYGYYSTTHVWVEYPSPRLVYVSPTYYRSHTYLYANPLHIHVTVPKGVTVGRPRLGSGMVSTSRGYKVQGCNSCRAGGGGTRYGSGPRSGFGSSGGSRSGRR
jgi:hypothetical protein